MTYGVVGVDCSISAIVVILRGSTPPGNLYSHLGLIPSASASTSSKAPRNRSISCVRGYDQVDMSDLLGFVSHTV